MNLVRTSRWNANACRWQKVTADGEGDGVSFRKESLEICMQAIEAKGRLRLDIYDFDIISRGGSQVPSYRLICAQSLVRVEGEREHTYLSLQLTEPINHIRYTTTTTLLLLLLLSENSEL